jgi:hypothetical protein
MGYKEDTPEHRVRVANHIRLLIRRDKYADNSSNNRYLNHCHNLATRLEKGLNLPSKKMRENYEAFSTMLINDVDPRLQIFNELGT